MDDLLHDAEPPPVDLVAQRKLQAEARAKAKAKAKGKSVAQKPDYILRKHKRNGVTAFAIASTASGKQVLQLSDVAHADAGDMVRGWIDRLNRKDIDVAAAVELANRVKSSQC